jgi:hypothetical protein
LLNRKYPSRLHTKKLDAFTIAISIQHSSCLSFPFIYLTQAFNKVHFALTAA